uniref:HAD-IIIC family phosphatase n=1 Tax=Faecousia sp. TaxID=2952921 RepID=UPI004027B8FC
MTQITFQQLKKLSKTDASALPQYSLAVLGDCATQHLATALRGYGVSVGMRLNVFDADYDQIDAQVMAPDSELYRFAPQGVLLQMCTEKLQEAFYDRPLEARASFAEDTYARIRQIWSRIGSHIPATVLQCNFPLIDDGVFGQFGNKTEQSFLFQQRKLNYLLTQGCQEAKNTFLIDLDALQTALGRSTFADPKLYYVAKMPISLAALPAAAKLVVDVVRSLQGAVKKCLVLDLDNTLWGGVIGDDGLSGIQIGELGTGHAFSDFQKWLKELKNRGILLTVCSKNNEDTAKEPFEKHPEMVLRLEDFSMFVANWEDKARNIRTIQQSLNIGMDSMVFLDDNPFERELVRTMIPEITVPELPEDPALYLQYLRGLDLFETASYSREDAGRTEQYREKAQRAAFEAAFQSYDDYLEALQMRASAAAFDPFHYPRIAQLTQRSNQFNLRTVRYTEAEIEALAQDDSRIGLYFTLKDKFGDHGLISVVVLEKQPEDTLFISEWLMSCRVLKRGMEEFIVDKILSVAAQQGFRRVVGEYIPTPKNAMVKDLYEQLGFARLENGRFQAEVSGFPYHKTFITEE